MVRIGPGPDGWPAVHVDGQPVPGKFAVEVVRDQPPPELFDHAGPPTLRYFTAPLVVRLTFRNVDIHIDPEALDGRYTAPKAGRYHLALGMWPHHVDDCTQACAGPPDATAPVGSTYREISFDAVPAMLSPGSYQLPGLQPAELERLRPTLDVMNRSSEICYATAADRPDTVQNNARLDQLRAEARTAGEEESRSPHPNRHRS